MNSGSRQCENQNWNSCKSETVQSAKSNLAMSKLTVENGASPGCAPARVDQGQWKRASVKRLAGSLMHRSLVQSEIAHSQN